MWRISMSIMQKCAIDPPDDPVALGLGVAVAERVPQVLHPDQPVPRDRPGRAPGPAAGPSAYDCSIVSIWATPTISRTAR